MKAAQDLKQANIKVGQAAKLLGVSVDTLRRWETQGKLVPMRTPGSTRLYSLDQLSKINRNLAPQNLQSKFRNSLRYLNISQFFLGKFLMFFVLVITGAAVIGIAYFSLPTQSDFLQNFSIKKDVPVKNLTGEKQSIALTTQELENSLPNAGDLPEVVAEGEVEDNLNTTTFSATNNFKEVVKDLAISPEDCLENFFKNNGI